VHPLSDSGFGALCAAGAALSWAVIGLLVRALSASFNSVTVNAARSTVGSALLLAWVLTTEGIAPLTAMSARTFALLAISVLLAVWLGDTAFFESTRALGLARAMTVSMTYPLFAALLAALFLGEALTLRLAVGSLLALGGLVLTVGRQQGGVERARFWPGMGAATLASLAWAVSIILLKPSLAEVDAVLAQAVRLPVAAVLLWATPWAWSAGAPWRGHESGALWRLFALGGLTAVSSIMFVASVQYTGVAVAAVLSSTAPMFAIPLGFVFLGERLALRGIVGTIVTVIGIGVLQL